MKKSATKKILITLTSLLMCLLLSISSFAAILGDVDKNGELKAADARLALRAAVKLETLSEEQIKLADVDCSGDVKSDDARSILRAAVGLEKLVRTHKFTEWKVVKQVSCTENGLQIRTCKCGEEETKTILSTGEHVFGKWTVTKKATCTADGVQTRTCECGVKETKKIPATGHSYTVKKATVSQSKVCTRCNKVAGKSFNEYVNSIKLQPHTLSYLSTVDNSSCVTKNTIKIDRTSLRTILLATGYSIKEANKEMDAMENELTNGMNYSEKENATFYKNRTLTENNYPIKGSKLVSELEDSDVVSFTAKKVDAVDFREYLGETYTATKTNYEYDTSGYRYLKADNLVKLTVKLKTEKYSKIKNSNIEKTALMKAANLDIRDMAEEILALNSMEDMGEFASAKCNEITTDATIIVYFDTANNTPVASCYITTIVCEPTITMDMMGMIEGTVDFTTTSKTVDLYFFDEYFS